jgi:hypothetical protein
MTYDQMLIYISKGARELDAAVDGIISSQSNGEKRLRVEGPAVRIAKKGNGFVVVKEK